MWDGCRRSRTAVEDEGLICCGLACAVPPPILHSIFAKHVFPCILGNHHVCQPPGDLPGRFFAGGTSTLTCLTCLVHKSNMPHAYTSHPYVTHLRVTTLVHMCAVTHSCVTRLIHTSHMPHSWHTSFITHRMHVCAMPHTLHACVCHAAYIYLMCLIFAYVWSAIRIFDMPHVYVWRVSF